MLTSTESLRACNSELSGPLESLSTSAMHYADVKEIFVLERWLDPLVPALRAYIRYAPIQAGKKLALGLLSREFRSLRHRRFEASTQFGTRIAGETSDILDAYIYCFGIWEPNLTHWVRSRLRPGDVFIDVGANIGYFSLLASRLVGDGGAIVAVEALPETFQRLQRNIELNRASNVRAVNAAAGARRGKVRLYRGPASNRGETTTAESSGFQPDIEVECLPLAEILTPEEARRARIIKIDVEGAEWEVVEGMLPLLGSCRPDLEIMVEINPKYAGPQGRRPEEILEAFAPFGFRPFRIANPYNPLTYLSSER